jgi:hypothetical protein
MSSICGCGNVTDSDYKLLVRLAIRAGGVALAQFVKESQACLRTYSIVGAVLGIRKGEAPPWAYEMRVYTHLRLPLLIPDHIYLNWLLQRRSLLLQVGYLGA